MCQSLRGGRATPTSHVTLGHLTFPAGSDPVALCAYAIGYRRHFLRIAELSEHMFAGAPSHLYRSIATSIAASTAFRAEAGFRFVWKTLLTSEGTAARLGNGAGRDAGLLSG